MGDYQALYRQLEAVESNIPSVGLVEETEDRLSDRITLFQVQLHHTHRTLDQTWLYHNIHTTPTMILHFKHCILYLVWAALEIKFRMPFE